MASIPQGKHNAICIGVIGLGTQKGIYYGLQKKVALLWEIHIGNQIKFQSREYTASFYGESKLREHLENWRGRPFTQQEMSSFKLSKLLGVPCQIEISKKNNQKFVENVLPFPIEEEKPIAQTEYIVFDITNEKTYPYFNKVPPYIISQIKQSPEYKQSGLDEL